jgi:hypothetical protein
MVQANIPESATALVAAGAYTPEDLLGPVAVVIVGRYIQAVWRGLDADSVRRRATQEFGGEPNLVDLGRCTWPPAISISIRTASAVTTSSRAHHRMLRRWRLLCPPRASPPSWHPSRRPGGRRRHARSGVSPPRETWCRPNQWRRSSGFGWRDPSSALLSAAHSTRRRSDRRTPMS